MVSCLLIIILYSFSLLFVCLLLCLFVSFFLCALALSLSLSLSLSLCGVHSVYVGGWMCVCGGVKEVSLLQKYLTSCNATLTNKLT